MKTLAQRYLNQPPTLLNGIVALRRDKLGRLVFADGSHLTVNAVGNPIYGRYDVGEWLAQEISATNLGRADRGAWKKFRSEFRSSSAQYPPRICKSYRDGYFSVRYV